jgi:hypothetical protein
MEQLDYNLLYRWFARCPARGLRGLYQEPGALGVGDKRSKKPNPKHRDDHKEDKRAPTWPRGLDNLVGLSFGLFPA